MLITYLEQLDLAAKRSGVDLMEVARSAGVAHSTIYRWRNGRRSPTEEVSRKLMTAIADHLRAKGEAA